jgi:hypothetical protein
LLHEQLLKVDGTARVDASESILAQELRLRADALLHAVNRRMRGRPGATIELRRLVISVGRRGADRNLKSAAGPRPSR